MEKNPDNEIVIIKNEKESLYMSNERAAYVKGRPYLYIMRQNDDLRLPGMEGVHANEFIVKKLLKLAADELDEYVRSNLKDVTMYSSEEFWKEGLFYIGRIATPMEPYVLWRRIEEGYLSIFMSGQNFDSPYDCYYDIREERLHIRLKRADASEDKPNPFSFADYVYGKAKRFALAMAQYGDGLIPAPFMELYLEISKLNGFLEGRRTTRADFGQGKNLICYPRETLTAATLIKLEKGRFVTYSYNYRQYGNDGNVIHIIKDDKKLPRRFFQRKDEVNIDAEVFEQVCFIPSNPMERKEHDYKMKLQEIEALISENVRYSYSKIQLQYESDWHDELYTCACSETLEQILQITQIRDLIRQRCTRGEIRITARTYTIGAGVEAIAVPDEVFKTMQELGHPLRYRDLKGYAEYPEREYLLDCGFLYRYMGADQEESDLPYNIQESLTRNMLMASLSKNTSYEYCALLVYGGGINRSLTMSGHIYSERDLLKIPLLRSTIEGMDEYDELTITVNNHRLGDGYLHSEAPEDILAVLKRFDAEVFASDKYALFSFPKKYYLDNSML